MAQPITPALDLLQEKTFAITRFQPQSTAEKLAKNIRLKLPIDSTLHIFTTKMCTKHLPRRILDFIERSIEGDILPSLIAFLDFAHVSSSMNDEDAYWFALKIGYPDPDFDVRRWHTDGQFWDLALNEGRTSYKIATVFKGAPTLLVDAIADERAQLLANRDKVYAKMGHEDAEMEERRTGAELLSHLPVQKCEPGEAVIFRNRAFPGCPAAVHSEPPINEPRIFCSVLFGTQAAIACLASDR